MLFIDRRSCRLAQLLDHVSMSARHGDKRIRHVPKAPMPGEGVQVFRLRAPGDLLALYTDGVTKALNDR